MPKISLRFRSKVLFLQENVQKDRKEKPISKNNQEVLIMRYSTIFFDLDDTLWDTAGNSRQSLKEVFHKYSFDKYYTTFDDFHAVYTPFNHSLWDLYEHNSITKQELMAQRFFTPFRHMSEITEERASEINKEFMELTSSKSATIDNAHEILDILKPHFKMCVLSNGFEEVQFKKMDNAGLSSYFEKVILSDHIGVNKPDPEIFNHALSQMQVTSDKVVMIGDNWNSDIVGAKNSNIDQIWYNPDAKEAKYFVPTYTISDLLQLKNILLSS